MGARALRRGGLPALGLLAALAAPAPAGARAACAEPAAVRMVLSPRMPYALLEWRRMRRAAEDAGFRVSALRDPRVPDEEWQAAVRAVDLPELADAPLLDEPTGRALGLLHHAPSSMVERCGTRHPWPILGVMPDAAWLGLLRQRAGTLK
ncbi:MAG TPA: hypothetical protein PKA16_04305 [Ottowia sp.]|uniref:hypothetical protein n=1 Tax=Ottowia sp. TaxID=1898956 RepID=UPI002C307F5F|nr:hypothetical protein [Ottowia sp.]HMN20597.1 hypothetical protein [Ottowia sp.]